MIFRKVLTAALTAAMLMGTASSAMAQSAANYPNKPIRFIVPYPAGGGSDALARMVGQRLQDVWGQPVIIENKPGANTILGFDALVKSPNDGYSILLSGGAVAVAPYLNKLPYDTLKDLAPVATVGAGPTAVVVSPAVAASYADLVALAKAKPDALNFASVGSGSAPHLAGETFNVKYGVKMKHVPYKGSAQFIPDLLTNRVQMYFIGPISLAEHIKSGKLSALAVSGESRLPLLPQVPTFAELGVTGMDVGTWFCVFTNAGVPKPIIDKLSAEIGKFMATPEAKEKLAAQGLVPLIKTADQFAVYLRDEMARNEKLVKAADIKGE